MPNGIIQKIDNNIEELNELIKIQKSATQDQKSLDAAIVQDFKQAISKRINQKIESIVKIASESNLTKNIIKKLFGIELLQKEHRYIAFMDKYPTLVKTMLNNDTTFDKYRNSSKNFISLIEDKPALAQILLEQHTGFKKFSRNKRVLEAIIEKGDQRVFMAFKNIIGQEKIKQMSQKLGLNLKAELEQMNQEATNVDQFIELLKENPEAAIDELKKDKDTQSYNLKDLDFGSKIRIMDAILKTQDLKNFNDKQDQYLDLFDKFYTQNFMTPTNSQEMFTKYKQYNHPELLYHLAKLAHIILPSTLNTLKKNPEKIDKLATIKLTNPQRKSASSIINNDHSSVHLSSTNSLNNSEKEQNSANSIINNDHSSVHRSSTNSSNNSEKEQNNARYFLHAMLHARNSQDVDKVLAKYTLKDSKNGQNKSISERELYDEKNMQRRATRSRSNSIVGAGNYQISSSFHSKTNSSNARTTTFTPAKTPSQKKPGTRKPGTRKRQSR